MNARTNEILEMHVLPKGEPGDQLPRCKGMELAEAYVRDQPLDSIYPPEEGLRMGTAFPNLSRPYGGWQRRPACY